MKTRPTWRVGLPNMGDIMMIDGKAFRPPERGWSRSSWLRDGATLIRLIVKTQRIVTRKAAPAVMRAASAVFDDQIARIVSKVKQRGLKAFVDRESIDVGGMESIWVDAINDVLRETKTELVAEVAKPLQSVAAQSSKKLTQLMALPEESGMPPSRVLSLSEDIAARVVRINEGTRSKMAGIIRKSLDDGDPVTTTARLLRESMTGMASTRLATIARTETSNAWTAAAVEVFQATPGLQTVSVIGCESREEERWGSPSYQQFMYRGESTCNIEDVPIEDADQLNFHPNHTGALIPSKIE